MKKLGLVILVALLVGVAASSRAALEKRAADRYTTALDLADAGYYVYLIEKSGAIGGGMSQLDKTFPTNDCSM